MSEAEMEMNVTAEKAIQVLKDFLVQHPLITITEFGKSVLCGLRALEEKQIAQKSHNGR